MGIITDVVLPLSLAFIMFSLGLALKSSDFTRVIKQPKDFLIGAFSQIIILPLVALIIVILWPLSPELAVGVMLIAAAPGGATSNIITSFAKGDVALSVSLTAIISLLCVITIPIIVLFSLNILMDTSTAKSISIGDIAIKMFLIVTVPVIIGMLFRKFLSSISISFGGLPFSYCVFPGNKKEGYCKEKEYTFTSAPCFLYSTASELLKLAIPPL